MKNFINKMKEGNMKGLSVCPKCGNKKLMGFLSGDEKGDYNHFFCDCGYEWIEKA